MLTASKSPVLHSSQPLPASRVIGGRFISSHYHPTPQFLCSEFPPISYCAIHRKLSIEIPTCSARPSTSAVQKDMITYAAETERLYLEPLGVQHLEDFHELWNNDEAVLWSYVPFPLSLSSEYGEDSRSKPKKNTLEESRDWLVNMILPTKETWDVDKYALLLKDETNEKGELKMVGFVGTNRWCEKGMEVGYCSNIKYWGTGYITEGFKAFLELYWTLPERMNVVRLVAKTHPENVASQRVCVKCGGKKGEMLKDSYERFVDGGLKSDVWLFYFDRPGVEVKDGSDGRVEMEAHKEEKQEKGDAA